MFKRFFAVFFLGFAALAAHADPAYTELPGAGNVQQPGVIEVREFFWYGCPHCYRLEPFLAAWLKKKPADVNFVRTPAAVNPVWEANARGYYTAEALGLVEKTHAALFQAIHVSHQQIFDQASIAAFYAGFGADPQNFNGLYNSFAVSGKVAQSKALFGQYHLEGVPALIVNGKYVIKGEDQKVIDTLNELVAKERAAHAGALKGGAAKKKSDKK